MEGGKRMGQLSARETWFTEKKILFLLFLTLFLIPLHPFGVYVGLIPALFVCLGRAIHYRKAEWKAGPLKIPALGFLVCSFLSVFVSKDPSFSLFNWLFQPLLYALLFILLYTYADSAEKKKKAFYFIFAGAVCVIFFGLFQYADVQNMANDMTAQSWVDPKRFPFLYRRMFSTLENPNLLAGYLLMILSFAVPFFLSLPKGKKKLLLGIFSLALLLCLALTYCRGAWISLAVIVAGLAIFYDKRFWLFFLVVPAVLLFYHGQIAVRFLSLFSGEDTSVDLRFALWESAEAMIEDHPLLGIGWGSFFLAYPDYNFYIQDPTVLIFHAHNMYINMLAEVGIPGGLFYLACFFGVFLMSFRNYKAAQDSFTRCLGIGGMLMTASLAVMGMGDHVLFSRAVSFCFWSLSALAMPLRKKH